MGVSQQFSLWDSPLNRTDAVRWSFLVGDDLIHALEATGVPATYMKSLMVLSESEKKHFTGDPTQTSHECDIYLLAPLWQPSFFLAGILYLGGGFQWYLIISLPILFPEAVHFDQLIFVIHG